MKEKLLEKLSEKDRQQLLEKEKKTGPNFTGLGFTYIRWSALYGLFLFIAIPLWFLAFEEAHPELLLSGGAAMFAVLKVLLYAVVFGFILDYILFIIKRINIIKLRRKYFEIVPRRKK